MVTLLELDCTHEDQDQYVGHHMGITRAGANCTSALVLSPRRWCMMDPSADTIVAVVESSDCTHMHIRREHGGAHPSSDHDGHDFSLVDLNPSLQHRSNTSVIYTRTSTSNRNRLHRSLSSYSCNHAATGHDAYSLSHLVGERL